MEEDIKILEGMLGFISVLNVEQRQALENLIKGYKELEELHKESGKEYELGRVQAQYETNELWESKIKEKIEEYKQEMKEIRAKEKGLIWNHRLHKLDYAIVVLQELMEDK